LANDWIDSATSAAICCARCGRSAAAWRVPEVTDQPLGAVRQFLHLVDVVDGRFLHLADIVGRGVLHLPGVFGRGLGDLAGILRGGLLGLGRQIGAERPDVSRLRRRGGELLHQALAQCGQLFHRQIAGPDGREQRPREIVETVRQLVDRAFRHCAQVGTNICHE